MQNFATCARINTLLTAEPHATRELRIGQA